MRCSCRRRAYRPPASPPDTTAQNERLCSASAAGSVETSKPPPSQVNSKASQETAKEDVDVVSAVEHNSQLPSPAEQPRRVSVDRPSIVEAGTECQEAATDCPEAATDCTEAVTDCTASADLSVVDAVSQLVEVLDAPETLKADAIHVIQAFAGGVASHCSAKRHLDSQTLELDFTHSLVGETATRSRVPVLLTLEQTLRLCSRLKDGGIIVETHGLATMPLDGVKECYTGVKAFWAEKGVSVSEGKQRQRAKLAWEYWLAHKMEFEHTKLFRVVDSFSSLVSVRLTVPTYVLEDVLMGYLCGQNDVISSMVFKTGKSGKTEAFATVVCQGDVTDSQYKWQLGFDMFVSSIVQNPAQLKFALKTSPSQATFGLWFMGLRAAEHGYEAACGCDPALLAKLFTVAKPEELGGAQSGSKWQVTDETWQLTGDRGRIIWHLPNSGE